MKFRIIGILLLALQLYFVVLGRHVFDKYSNAILLFIVSAMIPIYLFKISIDSKISHPHVNSKKITTKLLWSLLGMISIFLTYEELRKDFVTYAEFGKISDVIPQAQILYDRFVQGQFPYVPIPFETYSLQPIYFPFHWFPVFFSHQWPIDVRWGGWGILLLVVGLYGWCLKSQYSQKINLLIAVILPSLVLWAFNLFAKADLSVTYELVIGAYYLILVAGLLTRDMWLIGIGIACCLLSRFTLVFWLPLFAFVLLKDFGLRKSILVWSLAAVSIIAFLIIPFYLKDPSFIKRGLDYYVDATVADWIGSGDPPVSWTQENGISFAPIFKAILPGDVSHKVHLTQVVQSIALLLTLFTSLWAYKKWGNRIDKNVFLIITLYTFLCVYYFFAPLTYRYYLFSFLIVSSVLCGMIINSGSTRKNILPDQTIPQS